MAQGRRIAIVCVKPGVTMAVLSLFGFGSFAIPATAQETSPDSGSPQITIRTSTNLVLVDVVALKAKSNVPVTTLQRADFQILDNGRPAAIKTFDTGVSTRPLALWFVVQCAMPGWEAQGSGLFAGHTGLLEPALKSLGARDSVAVAHWCDNGDARLDLLPTNSLEKAFPAVEQVLAQPPDKFFHDRPGELALQKTLQLIVDATRSMPSGAVPVVIFLYGDWSAMPKPEADRFIEELLGTSAVAYGLKDRRSPKYISIGRLGGEQGAIANYIAAQTGGEYLRARPEEYAASLQQIIDQLHSRYELGFRTETLDGKRHKLEVKLISAKRKEPRGLRLRYRVAYVPIAQPAK
jgi:hypothetical protein